MRWLAPAAVLLCVPAVALASYGAVGPITLNGDSFSVAEVNCSGKVATGGGFAISHNGVHGASSSTEPDGDSVWSSRVHATTATAGKWRAFAICRGDVEETAAEQNQKTEAIENFGARVTARCPDGMKAVGGGYRVNPPRDPGTDTGSTLDLVESARVPGQGWVADGVGELEADGSLTAIVVCVESGRVVAASKRVDLRDRTQAKVTCPNGKQLVSGGFEWFGAPGALHSTMPISNKTWKASVRVSGQPDPDAFLKVIAYCMAK